MISAVINTFNEERNLARAVASARGLADEIVVVDMESTDNTREVARKLGTKVFTYKKEKYVEAVRNFMISKASGEWILILDPDEEISPKLAKILKGLPRGGRKDSSGVVVADYYRIPRKNIIFGKWIKHCRWWPDFQIRFFKKGYVSWNEVIHAVPMTQGKGLDLPEKEDLAIIHKNYSSLEEYLAKMNRYTSVQAEELLKNGYVFDWKDLIKKPFREFLGRYFAGQGYKDGVHGLTLCFLQSFSELVLYLKIWQKQGFREQEIKRSEIKNEFGSLIKELRWWLRKELTWLKLPKWR